MKTSPFIFDEESLGDPLVNDHDGDFRGGCQIIKLLDNFAELRNLPRKYLLAHGITDTIAVDNEVSRLPPFIALLEAGNSLPYEVLHLAVNDLLALWHKQVI